MTKLSAHWRRITGKEEVVETVQNEAESRVERHPAMFDVDIAPNDPLLMYFQNTPGVVDIDTLRTKRRHIILAILVIAAMITPPDPLTQIVVAIPMLGLYETSILILKLKEGKSEDGR